MKLLALRACIGCYRLCIEGQLAVSLVVYFEAAAPCPVLAKPAHCNGLRLRAHPGAAVACAVQVEAQHIVGNDITEQRPFDADG